MNLFHFIAKLKIYLLSLLLKVKPPKGWKRQVTSFWRMKILFQIADNDHKKSATKCQKCDSLCLRDQGKAASVYFYINYLGSETTNYVS